MHLPWLCAYRVYYLCCRLYTPGVCPRKCRQNAKSERLLLTVYHVNLPSPAEIRMPGHEDINSVELLRAYQPSVLDLWSPRATIGDGNCLYRAVSLGAYGTQKYHLVIRLLSALEIVENQETYDGGIHDLVSNNCIIVPTYAELVRRVATPSAYADMYAIYAVSAVVGAPIQSYHPSTGPHDNQSAAYTTRILGRNVRSSKSLACTIMWTSTFIPSATVACFNPNHFVVLARRPSGKLPVVIDLSGEDVVHGSSHKVDEVDSSEHDAHDLSPSSPLLSTSEWISQSHGLSPSSPLPCTSGWTSPSHDLSPSSPLLSTSEWISQSHGLSPSSPLPCTSGWTSPSHGLSPSSPLLSTSEWTSQSHGLSPSSPLPCTSGWTSPSHGLSPSSPLPCTSEWTSPSHGLSPSSPLLSTSEWTSQSHGLSPSSPLLSTSEWTSQSHGLSPSSPLPCTSGWTSPSHDLSPSSPLLSTSEWTSQSHGLSPSSPLLPTSEWTSPSHGLSRDGDVHSEVDSRGDEGHRRLRSGNFLSCHESIDVLTHVKQFVEEVPPTPKENVYFIVKNDKNIARRRRGQRSQFFDNCGAWDTTRGNTRATLYVKKSDGHYIFVLMRNSRYRLRQYRKGGESYVPLKPQPTADEVVEVVRHYSTLKANSTYQRRITWISKGPGSTSKDWSKVALWEYKGELSKVAKHSGCTSNSTYCRTPPGVMKKIGAMAKTTKPLEVYNTMVQQDQDVQSKKQIYNKKYRQSRE